MFLRHQSCLQLSLLLIGEGRLSEVDEFVLSTGQKRHQTSQTFPVMFRTPVFLIQNKQIEGVEVVTNAFTVQNEVPGELANVLEHGLGKADEQTLLIDTVDLVTVFPHQHPPAIDLLLHHIARIGEQTDCLLLVNGVQELRENASESIAHVRCGVWSAVFTWSVALGRFLTDQFVEDAFGLLIFDGHIGLRASVQGRSSPAVSEIDDKAFTRRLNGALVHFV